MNWRQKGTGTSSPKRSYFIGMPFENPFKSSAPKPRSRNDAKFVRDILGKKEADAFENMLGEAPAKAEKEVEAALDTELSRSEKATIETDFTEEPWARGQLVTWAEGFNAGEDWIDETFVFNPDGTFESTKTISLFSYGISELPRGWKRVNGNLDLSSNKLTSLKGIPTMIEGGLILRNNPLASIKSLPAPKNIKGEIYIDQSQADKFESWLDEEGYSYMIV